MRRLFLAVWPEDDQVERLIDIQDQCRMKSGRLVAPENFHITLLFLGDVRANTEDCLVTACRTLNMQGVELEFSELGYFPKSQILWFGPRRVPAALSQLHQRLRKMAGQCQIGHLSKRFIPHVSLVRRCVRPAGDPGFQPFAWKIQEFHLVQSTLYPDGAQYEIVETFPMSACSA